MEREASTSPISILSHGKKQRPPSPKIPRVLILPSRSSLISTHQSPSSKAGSALESRDQSMQQLVSQNSVFLHSPNVKKLAADLNDQSIGPMTVKQRPSLSSNSFSSVTEPNPIIALVTMANVSTAQNLEPFSVTHEIIVENNFPTITVSDINNPENRRILRSGNAYNIHEDSFNHNVDDFDRNLPPLSSSPSSTTVVNIPEDEISSQFSHNAKTSPVTIQWLLQNYETAEGVSLPRCTLYTHYISHCTENRLEPVNSASFGKLIRSVFLGLRTRRLGTRGNSKYHYYGIRIKADSELNKQTEEAAMIQRQQAAKKVKLMNSLNCGVHPQGHANSSPSSSTTTAHHPFSTNTANNASTPLNNNTSINNNSTSLSGEDFKSFLGPGLLPNFALPQLSSFDPQLQRIGLSVAQAEKFLLGYRQHCEDILDCLKNLLFNDVESCWRQFWQSEENGVLEDELDDDEDENSDLNLSGLTRTQLYSICTLPFIQEFIQTIDFQFYQTLVTLLVPDVLKQIPSQLTQSIRSFAKNLENGLAVALQGAPEVVVKLKLDAVSSFSQTLRRYTTLNHLAQAARAVFQNPTQITQMLNDLNRVDFRNMHEQASWVCYCNPAQVEEIEKSFKLTLEKQVTLEQWAVWLENVVDKVLHSAYARPPADFIQSAKEFLLKWSFYSSMIMRDLTLRSAPSFGSFHLIRLLYDEYMFYLIEQRIARATGQTTVAIMSQICRNHMQFGNVDYFNDLTSYVSGSLNQGSQSTFDETYGHVIENSHVVNGEMITTVVDNAPTEETITTECYLNGHSDAVEEFLIPAHQETITITAETIADCREQIDHVGNTSNNIEKSAKISLLAPSDDSNEPKNDVGSLPTFPGPQEFHCEPTHTDNTASMEAVLEEEDHSNTDIIGVT